MKTTFKLLITIVLLLAINNIYAQSHDMSPCSTCKLITTKGNSETHICPACKARDKKQKEAKAKRQSEINKCNTTDLKKIQTAKKAQDKIIKTSK